MQVIAGHLTAHEVIAAHYTANDGTFHYLRKI